MSGFVYSSIQTSVSITGANVGSANFYIIAINYKIG